MDYVEHRFDVVVKSDFRRFVSNPGYFSSFRSHIEWVFNAAYDLSNGCSTQLMILHGVR